MISDRIRPAPRAKMSVKEKIILKNLTRYDQFLISSSPDLIYYDKIRQVEMVGFPSETTRYFSMKIRSDSGRQHSDSTRSRSSGFRRIPMNSDSIRRWIRSEVLGIESRKARPETMKISVRIRGRLSRSTNCVPRSDPKPCPQLCAKKTKRPILVTK